MRDGESILIRHADKGKWEVNDEELASAFPKDVAVLVRAVLKEELPEASEIPLTLEGLKRTLKLADEMFRELPDDSILVVADSGKDRAHLTSALVTARLHQMETQHNVKHKEFPKNIDMLKIDAGEISKMLADAHGGTWQPYGEMVQSGEKTELEAMAQWIMDTNQPNADIDYPVSPKEAGQRYRQLIQNIRSRVTATKKPVIFFGVGHSGGLAQIGYELNPAIKSAEDMPDFCEIHKFDSESNLIEKRKVEI